MPYQVRDLGVTVLGQTGYGKTTLLEQLILQDVARGTSVIVIDAHGDLTQRVLSLAETDDENLLLLEAWEDAPFRLNLFECPNPTSAIAVDRTVSGIVQVFKRLFGSPREFYPRLERDLGNAARTVIANNGTLLDVPRLFWDAEFRAAALERVTNPRVHEFWRLWERIGRADRQLEQLEATINRLDQFLASEFVAQVVGSTESTIPFDEMLDGDGRVLLLSLPVGEIGEGLANLLGSLFLAVLTERIFARSRLAPEDRPRVHLYLDEYGRYATPTTAQLLTEGRKFGIGTTIAHQTRAQIPDEENRAAELQVGTLLCFQLIGEDAQELSGEFHVEPDPQWEERVEEIEGEEPELAISPNPVEHLINSGHRDPAVREVVREFLAPLVQQKDRAEARIKDASRKWDAWRAWKEHRTAVFSERPPIPDRTLPTTCELIDGALTDVMDRQMEDISITITRVLSEYWGKLFDDEYANLIPSLSQCEQAYTGNIPPDEEWMWDQLRQQEYADMYRHVSDFIRSADAIVAAGGDPTGKPHEVKLADQWYKYCSLKARTLTAPDNLQEWVKKRVRSVSNFVYPILILLNRLADDPILVPTGQQKPRVRVRYITHPQRSYQDVQNELAVQLANLPRFIAYVSIQGAQRLIRLDPPIQAKIDEERIDRIRWVSKAKFGRLPKPTVPPAASDETAEPPAGPRIARGHPDEE